MTNRIANRILEGIPTQEGAGVKLSGLLGTPRLDYVDPFLLLDEFRSDQPDDYIAGFPEHPHRGFETVTYLKLGRFRHRDSNGNEGLLNLWSLVQVLSGVSLTAANFAGCAWGADSGSVRVVSSFAFDPFKDGSLQTACRFAPGTRWP